MTPFDVIFDTFDGGGDADDVLAALAAAGFVVVACPPGSRVVVDRSGTPCDECNGKGEIYEMGRWSHCNGPCGGSGVVEATTTTAVEPGRGELIWESVDGAQVPRWVETWRAVALPEETPHA